MYFLRISVLDLPISPVYKFLIIFAIVASAYLYVKTVSAKHTYKCRECGQQFKLKWYKVPFLTVHEPTGRFMKCPHCHKHGWCKYDDD